MILACDVGTSAVKAGIIDEKGVLRSYSREPVTVRPDKELVAGSWHDALIGSVHNLDKNSLAQIRAVAVSGNGPTIVAMDKLGKALAPVLFWYGKEERGACLPGSHSYFLPKIAWLQKHRARLYEKARFFLPCPEYICYLFTGEICTALPQPGYREYFWSEADIKACGLDSAKFPQFIDFTSPAGKITRAAHLEYGLPGDIPVFSGGPDFLMSLLGTAAVVPGSTHDRAGSSEGLNHCSGRPAVPPGLRMVPGVGEGTYNISGILPFSGKMIEQAVTALFPQAASFTAALEEALAPAPEAGVVPYVPPVETTVLKRKNWLAPANSGFRQGLAPAVKLRAVLEAVTMQLRLILEKMQDSGLSITAMSISGGQAQSAGLIQLKADITGTSIKIPAVPDSELVGGACVALTGLGEYAAVQEAAVQLVHFPKTIEPRRVFHDLYEDRFNRFKTMIFKRS